MIPGKIIRKACVEGRFYPAGREAIFDQIGRLEASSPYPDFQTGGCTMLGAVLPHAGHVYSGPQSIPFFRLLRNTEVDTFVIVHPVHSGKGPALVLDESDCWINSIGEVQIDRTLSTALELPASAVSHAMEHSAEVLIPYLQYFMEGRRFSILPVGMVSQDYRVARDLGHSLGRAVQASSGKVLVLASCDFCHFLPPEEGYRRDQFMVEAMLKGDAPGVEQAVFKRNISACGYGPVMCLMEYSAIMAPDYRLEVLARGHSGEVHPSGEVVDYISFISCRWT